MNDLIPLGTGNSRFMKSGISPNTTYQQLLTMLINGTFPFDFNGINPAGVSQMGSAYSVANVLPEDVCSALGIPNTSEPKDAFAQLQANIGAITNIIVASRVGTGTTSFSVTFPQKPRYVFWLGELSMEYYYSSAIILFTPGVDAAGTTKKTCNFISTNSGGDYDANRQWSSNGLTLTISRQSSSNYINSTNIMYYYIYIL